MRLLMTAGPTREYFDDVRFISNASSGRMGYALAAQAVQRGHHVVLISGPVARAVPDGVECVPVLTGSEMLAACLRHFEDCDAAMMCAAVCDYRPAGRTSGKVPKIAEAHHVTLEPTEDICATLGRMKGRRLVVGFALESEDAQARAEAKCRHKHCDAMVLNHPAGIGRDQTRIEVFTPREGWSAPRSGPKLELAAFLLEQVERWVGA